ncbi:hypothetical protein KDA_56970 [Dictyobacter alpinus]|uniref:DUF4926 domain-containing protein n=1 Tax=Dictyobacter alpinus TaxID=2014873 RepID=A0A402BFP5_9CHLR|nr:hypothetical protein [Dictyobacter alpinus]GCE30213.1 hypothetical protein KDA_56970 [Dictyobacter alpinus]
METTQEGTYFQEGDRVRIKQTGEQGSVNATDGGVVYVVMDTTEETRVFSAYCDKDSYIDFVQQELKAGGAGKQA